MAQRQEESPHPGVQRPERSLQAGVGKESGQGSFLWIRWGDRVGRTERLMCTEGNGRTNTASQEPPPRSSDGHTLSFLICSCHGQGQGHLPKIRVETLWEARGAVGVSQAWVWIYCFLAV